MAPIARTHKRPAAVVVLTVVSLVVLLGFAALAVDVGYLYNVRAELQNGADAASLAAAQRLPDAEMAREAAFAYAERNQGAHGQVLADGDLILGHWDAQGALFTPNGNPTNAVRVTLRRSQSNGNSVHLFFAGIFGKTRTNVSASATAAGGEALGRVRFLLDDEVLDTDEPVIKQLAAELGVSEDNLLRDGDGDGFIDIPGGEIIEVPTGQKGDEGLFAIEEDEFEFTPNSHPSLTDFLLYDEKGDRRGITDSDLDPLTGVDPVSDSKKYPSFVNPDQVLVSPVYKSDVSNTSPYVNAKGERRGLLAYKIIAVGSDPDGKGSKFPNLVFEIVDPATVDLDSLTLGGAGPSIVQLVE